MKKAIIDRSYFKDKQIEGKNKELANTNSSFNKEAPNASSNQESESDEFVQSISNIIKEMKT